VRNLSAAEDAVQKGQFNIAKVLRAAAHSRRILAKRYRICCEGARQGYPFNNGSI